MKYGSRSFKLDYLTKYSSLDAHSAQTNRETMWRGGRIIEYLAHSCGESVRRWSERGFKKFIFVVYTPSLYCNGGREMQRIEGEDDISCTKCT